MGRIAFRLFPAGANADARRLVFAKGLRAIADGYVSVILPVYLLALGHSAFEVGVLTTATLLGSAGLTLVAGAATARFGHREPLLAACALMIFTGFGFATLREFWPLLLVAFIGTLNPSSGDVSVFLPLEQSLLAQVGHRRRPHIALCALQPRRLVDGRGGHLARGRTRPRARGGSPSGHSRRSRRCSCFTR